VRSFVEEIYSRYIPNKIIAGCEPGDEHAADAIRLLSGRSAVNADATAYICRNYTCLEPATTVEGLAARLDE
jgi:uncharacterized protein YyaL (SSP411 family)